MDRSEKSLRIKNVAQGWGGYTTATKVSGSAPSSFGFCRSCLASAGLAADVNNWAGCTWAEGPWLGPHGTPSRFARKVDRPCPCSFLLPLSFSGKGCRSV